jgi:hypothetical protein
MQKRINLTLRYNYLGEMPYNGKHICIALSVYGPEKARFLKVPIPFACLSRVIHFSFLHSFVLQFYYAIHTTKDFNGTYKEH